MKVFHSTDTWLPETQNWIFTQVKFLPKSIDSQIVCRATKNLGDFSFENFHQLGGLSKGRGLCRFERWLGVDFVSTVGAHLCEWVEAAGLILSHGGDILHSHFGPRGWYDLPIAYGADVSHVVTFYGVDVNYTVEQNPEFRHRYALLFECVDAVLCEGEHMADRIVELGCSEKKVHVHRLGIELDKYDFVPRRRQPGESFRILMAAAFRKKKGFVDGIRALGELLDDVDFKVTVVGDEPDYEGPVIRPKEDLERLVDDIGIEDRVNFVGFKKHDELLELAKSHHVFLAPSISTDQGDTEGGAPVTIIEMMATGMPVVGTNHCDIPNIVEDGTSGFLVDEGDVDGLADYLKWLAEHSEKWEGIGVAGRELVEDNHSAEKQGARLAKIYRSIEGQ